MKRMQLLALADLTCAVSSKQSFQFPDLLTQDTSGVGVINRLTAGNFLYNQNLRMDITSGADRFLSGGERLMVYELESVRVGDQGITCNSGCGLVGTGETSVNDEELTAALDRGFTLLSA